MRALTIKIRVLLSKRYLRFVPARDHTGYGFCSQTRTVISVALISKVKSHILERQGCVVLVQLLTRPQSSLTTSP